jgi:hypothetical protein
MTDSEPRRTAVPLSPLARATAVVAVVAAVGTAAMIIIGAVAQIPN